MVTGFQAIVQPADSDQLGKLYANHTSGSQTSVTVEVEQNGKFLVSVIPVLGETGIINSSVEYAEVVVVEDLLAATSTGCLYVLLLGSYHLFSYILSHVGNIADTELRKDIFFGNWKY